MLKSMSAAAGVECVRQRRRRVWSRVLSVRRVASRRRRRASNHTNTHTDTVAHGIRVIARARVCVLAVAIKTRPAESAAAARDSVGLRSSS